MSYRGYIELERKFVAPRIVVVDDKKEEVDLLAEYLEDEGFEVLHFPGSDEFLHWLGTHSLQVMLVDVALGPGRDRGGLTLVMKAAEGLASAIRICISQRTIGAEIGAQEIIALMNPDTLLKGRRAFHAFADKAQQA